MTRDKMDRKKNMLFQVLKKGYSVSQLFIKESARTLLKFCKEYKWTIIVVLFPLALFVKLSRGLIDKELSNFDDGVYRYVSRFISDNMTEFMKFISFLGTGWVLIIITLIIIGVLWKNRKYNIFGWMIASNLALSSLLNEVLKAIFQRPRPEIFRLAEAGGFSFPSGHSMTGMGFYGFLIYLCIKHFTRRSKYCVSAVLGLLVIFIGISRIYLGVHYASDVIAGFSAGLVWLSVVITSANRIYLKRNSSTAGDSQ